MNVKTNTITIKDQQDQELKELYASLYEAQEVINSIDSYDCSGYVKYLDKIEWRAIENNIFSKILKHPSTLRNRDKNIRQFSEEIEHLRDLIKKRNQCSKYLDLEFLSEYNDVTEKINLDLLNKIKDLEEYRYQFCDR
jgi:hypothetical protein